ncbi:MAG: hypothetical protein F6K39_06490 [Okeania sp. SIO3B3]|nr:hypothetical protein [Okeania sp. SIO3B3]
MSVVIMPDHVHCLIVPFLKKESEYWSIQCELLARQNLVQIVRTSFIIVACFGIIQLPTRQNLIQIVRTSFKLSPALVLLIREQDARTGWKKLPSKS